MSPNNIPSEIWREILVRLPAESLIRTRAVSKGLRAVIDDPCFVRAHANKHQQKLVILQNIPFQPDNPCYSLDLEALSCINGHQAIAATPLDLDFIGDGPDGYGLRLPVAACDGLIHTQKPLAIWNPLTHERLDLPDPGDFSNGRAFGLGYDCATDDYKAVVIMGTRDTHVYSLKSDSWRRIMNCPCDGDLWGPVGPGVFVCGGLNWLSKRQQWGAYDDKIVALDLGTEKYSLLQMPPQTRRSKHILPPDMLHVLGGCLAMCDNGYNSPFDVWVMKVYGDDDSWIKLFSIEREHNISTWQSYLRPVAFIMERLVFLQDKTKRFYLFDIETKSLKWVKIDGSGLYSYAKQMFVGTIFRLHANCGGGRNIVMSCTKKKRKITSCPKKKRKITRRTKKKKASGLVFCIRDANGKFFGGCSERGVCPVKLKMAPS